MREISKKECGKLNDSTDCFVSDYRGWQERVMDTVACEAEHSRQIHLRHAKILQGHAFSVLEDRPTVIKGSLVT